MSTTIRAFIAIDLGAELRSLLLQVGQEIDRRVPAGAVRWVRPEAMHLTLVFLGDTPQEKLGAVQTAMRTAAARCAPITLSAEGIGCFPNTRRPRVVWVGVKEPAGQLAPLKRALDRELEPLGFKPEQRSFSPHLTLGRLNKRAGSADIQAVGAVVESATLKDVATVTATEIHLIRSQLRPQGPLYTTLASVPLNANPDHQG